MSGEGDQENSGSSDDSSSHATSAKVKPAVKAAPQADSSSDSERPAAVRRISAQAVARSSLSRKSRVKRASSSDSSD